MATGPASSTSTFLQPFEEMQSTDPALPESPIPGHFELPLNVEQNRPGYPDHQSGLRLNGLSDLHDLLLGPFFWPPCNGSLDEATTSFQYSGLPGEGCNPILLENYNGSLDPVFGDDSVRALSLSAPPSCTDAGCQVLREITHTKGMHVKKLQIHGRLDLREFAHAIVEECDLLFVEECDLLFPIEHQCQLTDFQNGSYELVNNFLDEYLETCAQEGYDVQRDHPSNFYDTLSVGLNDLPSSPEKTGGSNQGPGRFNKKYSLKEQVSRIIVFQLAPFGELDYGLFVVSERERTRKMKLTDFKAFIHLPAETAAREMEMCITTLKKICSENKIRRWPHRKIKSIESRIAKNRKILEEGGDHEKQATALEDIQKCEQELAGIYEPFTQQQYLD